MSDRLAKIAWISIPAFIGGALVMTTSSAWSNAINVTADKIFPGRQNSPLLLVASAIVLTALSIALILMYRTRLIERDIKLMNK